MPAAPDVTVIGAGPAGGAAATLLARAGWRVTLLEQHRFPRDKVCGECVSALGFDVLTRLGLHDRFRALGAVPLNFTALHGADGRAVRLPLPRPMWGLSRRALDQLLLDAARTTGVAVRQPARCEALGVDGLLSLGVRDLATNAVGTSHPAWAIVADGKAALAGRPPAATGDFGLKAHFAGIAGPADAIELFAAGGTYGGLAPIEAARWNAAFSVPAALLKQHPGDLDALFERLAASNPVLRDRLAGAARVGPWLASPLPRFPVTRSWPARVVPVGNAAAALEPVGGEGMGLALRSAELAAEALVRAEGDATRFDRAALFRAYDDLWRTRRAACRLTARALSSPAVGPLALRALRRYLGIGRVAMGWMGKDA